MLTFWAGMALVAVALAIWLIWGRTPTVLRTLENGDRVLGPPSVSRAPPRPDDAVDVRRIARDPPPSDRLADVRPGQQLTVSRVDSHWIIADTDGRLAHVGRVDDDVEAPRPGPVERDGADDPDESHRQHEDPLTDPIGPLTAPESALPDHGTLHVDRILQDRDGRTIDLRGPVHPEQPDDLDLDDPGADRP